MLVELGAGSSHDPTAPPDAPHAASPVHVLHEDEHLLAVDKPAGMVVHPAYRHPDGTLYDFVAARQRRLGAEAPCLLHRLDRDTSGVVLFAKSERARRSIVAQFERHQVRKWYLALVIGRIAAAHGTVEQPLRRDPADRRRVIVDATGQPATTEWETVAAGEHASLLLVQPRTGRTHQIRAHLGWLGYPLMGDTTYASLTPLSGLLGASRQMLHAWCLCVRHPASGDWLRLQAPVPSDLRTLLPPLWLAAAEAALRARTPT